MDYPGFIGGSYQSQAYTADQEHTVNWYTEAMESPNATSKAALYPTPGVTELAKANVGSGRAHYYVNGREFAVIGTTLYEVSSQGVLTSRGTVAYDANPATISSNGDAGGELFITSGGNGYVYNLAGNTLTLIAALAGKATMGDMLDGFFLALDGNNSTLYISNLLDGTTWQATQFARRNLAPDRWVAMKVIGRYIWLFGEQTSEVWYDSGGFPFPFAPYSIGLIPYGIGAPFSVAVTGTDICWLQADRSGSGKVMRTSGFSPQDVSTQPLQVAIGGYGVISDAVGDSYTDQGHTFYLLSFVRQDVTWTCDLGTGLWAQRGTWLSDQNRFGAWRPRWHAAAFSGHRMLDATNGAVYTLSGLVGTDVDGLAIRRVRRAPGLQSNLQRVFYGSFELDMEPATALVTGQGSDPQVMLRMSNDGGKTWGTEAMRPSGMVGEYTKRVGWNRCGSARRRVFEVSVSDPVPWRLTAAYLSANVAGQKQKEAAA